jgi:hypothetical protein
MEDMKLLKAIIILTSIFFFTSAYATEKTPGEMDAAIGEMPDPIFIEDEQMSFPSFLWRGTQYMRFRLKKDEKKIHQSAVFFMLNNAPNGEIVSWYSDKRLANGKIRAIHSYPISGGFCRTYQALIQVNGKSRHMSNNACLYIGSDSWVFYK